MSNKTELLTVDETCGACRYWDLMHDPSEPALGLDPLDDTDISWGRCRRFPPVYVQHEKQCAEQSYIFPRTAIDAWCGEWRPKK